MFSPRLYPNLTKSIQAPSTQRVLLLDFDGVILRHKPVLHKIQERVVDYVQKNVHNGYLTEKDADRLNRDLYSRYGHTHTGMKKLFLPFSRLSNFNEYVYNPVFLQSLYHEFATDETLHKELKEFRDWVKNFEETSNIPCYIFTNSPALWCELWLMHTPGSTHIHGVKDIFGSDHTIFETPSDNLLKPNPVLYRRIESYLSYSPVITSKKDASKATDLQFVFVDDSIANLEPLITRPMWFPIWFGHDNLIGDNVFLRMNRLEDLNQILV